MADTIECPYCMGAADLVRGCQACNGAGVIGMHNAPERPARPPGPVQFVAVSTGTGLAAVDTQGRVWRREHDLETDTWDWMLLESPTEPGQ